jgi:chemotaxis protein CheZ
MLKDLRELVQFIHQAKTEIAAIRPDEIKSRHLMIASDELDAIVLATEDATNEIMEAAEAVESIAADVTPAQADVIGDAVTRIYQACSFQDITGQRISKVVGALKHIEAKVESMLTLLGGKEAAYVRVTKAVEAEVDADPDAKLLNGPQLGGPATSQDEIDALFG